MNRRILIVIAVACATSSLSAQTTTTWGNGLSINMGISGVNQEDFATFGPGFGIQGKFHQTLGDKVNLVSTLGYSSQGFIYSKNNPEIGTGGVIKVLDLGMQAERVLVENKEFKLSAALGVGISSFTTTAFVSKYVQYTSKYTGETWFNLVPEQVQSVTFPVYIPVSISAYKNINNKFAFSVQTTYNLCSADDITNFISRLTTVGVFYKLK